MIAVLLLLLPLSVLSTTPPKSKSKSASKTKSTSAKPSDPKVVGVLVNRAKLPKTESAYMETLLKHRWTVHTKGLQLLDAPKDSLVFDIGIKIGDVLVAVNEHPMDGMQSIIDGAKSVREECRCNLLVYRDRGIIQFNVSAK